MNFTDKEILITGASGGLGKTFINYCLEQNVKKIYCCARNIENLQKLYSSNEKVEILTLDITKQSDIDNVAKSINSIDILINNAGFNSEKRIFEIFSNDFEINTFGTLKVSKTLSSKIKQTGKIITINSILAFINLPTMALYCASKSALHSIMQAFRAELQNRQIEVYEVFPGPIDTSMAENLQMPKTSPRQIVEKSFEALENKTFEVFPDDFSQNIYSMLKTNQKELEKEFASSVQQ
ncbi:SDR family NAD(P)-dependent oxidoreductase [Aliarcobacter butzleri]|uniref:SDR family NAD(P)-dependent oxidoreductase n=1 Tax=Aliarcobacter butzleri TaxID=28197 RepID=A0AAW7QA28_9BACT|nr:SDR family NAD(P)-dependent oxidoreductase [Aliarcobacter butzleri]MDN5107617.1 SDR family NAD(P)-dependent oxidoreductase [Aliarcobacter butzleri]MDN5122941.1 SDR family NAD(P)-dependent oxidoreductase [Aliarcobacter butzleri]